MSVQCVFCKVGSGFLRQCVNLSALGRVTAARDVQLLTVRRLKLCTAWTWYVGLVP